jgi:transmembrane sensor
MAEDRFIELLAKKFSDELYAGELEMFNNLLASSEFYRKQYNFFKDYWVQDQEQYSNSNAMFERIRAKIIISEPEADIIATEEHKYKKLLFVLKRIAAILIIIISIAGIFFALDSSLESNATAHLDLTKTPSRLKSRVTLSDGSVVTLNSETTLKYPPVFNRKTREVYLNGEAFFDVTKDHTRPFIVHTGKMSIKVLGTAFNIKSYDNDVQSETTLIRGAIEVTLKDRPSDRIILKPHEKLVLKSTTIKAPVLKRHPLKTTPDSVNTSYALTTLTYLRKNDTTVVETSWVNNRLVFKDEEFKNLANKMERWYGIKVKFKNSSAKDYHFTGVFEKESVSQAFNALKMIEPFTFNQKNETIYIY